MPYTRFTISKKYFILGIDKTTSQVVKYHHKFKEGVSTIALEKKQLNTPINSLILDDFRKACDQYNLKMNVVLEALMNEFIDGNYKLTVSRHGVKIKIVKK